jgi:hypothetical protein
LIFGLRINARFLICSLVLFIFLERKVGGGDDGSGGKKTNI